MALSGNIGAAVYDGFAPENVSYPYVIISSQTSVQRWIKRARVYDVQITLDIVTGSQSVQGMSQAEGIAEAINDIILPSDYKDIDITANGFKIGDTRRASDNHITSRNELFYVYRKLMTYELIVTEN